MKKIKRIALFLLIMILIFLVTYYIFYYRVYKVRIDLIGSPNEKVLYGSTYNDSGVVAQKCTLAKCINVTNEVNTSSNVDTSTIGEYKITYKYKNYKEFRKVLVYEDILPVISLKGDVNPKLCLNSDYVEEGYVASDNYDGDITDKVTVSKDDKYIYYNVVDSSNNKATAFRTIDYSDTTKPTIKLKGKSVVSIYVGGKYNEAGYSAVDNCDGDITDKVKVVGSVNTSVKGTYTLTYQVSDSNNNMQSVKRTVNVYDFNVSNANEYIKSFENYLSEKNYNVSIGYYRFDNGYSYTYKPNTIYYGASLVKTVDALYAYEKMDLDDNIRQLVKSAISVSDNDAHKKLVNMIGRSNLKKYADSNIGTKNFLDVNTAFAEYYGNTTVYDQMAIWKYLYNFIGKNENGMELRSYFINGYGNYLLFNGSPGIMHKYGKTNEYYHDVGIVFANKPYLVVVLTKECCDNITNIIEDISKKIYVFNGFIN